MTAFYNEPDPYAAAWLENLIAAGHIAPGIVDRRPIQEIEAWELEGFTQCHFFAGIGIWSHALRRAGWSDDRPIWTGSCPCQPFSAAGQRKGIHDERHLWPFWHKLIEQRLPAIVVGEQVASKDGLGWLDTVSADLEGADYAFGASDLCAAGFGQAHIRQRLYFVGLADSLPTGRPKRGASAGNGPIARSGAYGRVEHTDKSGQYGWASSGEQPLRNVSDRTDQKSDSGDSRQIASRWLDVDWLLCRNPDGEPSWRPVEAGTFPLAHGVAGRMGKLRAFGNGLDAETATNFCEVVREIADDLRPLVQEYDL